MIQILLHSSKTMRDKTSDHPPVSSPMFLRQAEQLATIFRSASTKELMTLMKLSEKKAAEVATLYQKWTTDPSRQLSAIDAFIGDIYSGLQVPTWTDTDRVYAQDRLLILSGLYGALRPGDGITPYRLEMGYKLPRGSSLYVFWAETLAASISPHTTHIINLSAVEYTKALLPYIDAPVITPKFLTRSPKTGEPTFVTVHTKIARGAFARWLIQQQIENIDNLQAFSYLGYTYNNQLSTLSEPVFICEKFKGLGLSLRLT